MFKHTSPTRERCLFIRNKGKYQSVCIRVLRTCCIAPSACFADAACEV